MLKVGLCLNPCSNGMTIEYEVSPASQWYILCLNPCSNGMTIESVNANDSVEVTVVLILVLME